MSTPYRAGWAVGALLFALMSARTAFADLDQQLNAVFGVMTNTVPPAAAISDARRGVISGGSFVLRNRISTPAFVTFAPPSSHMGCGGIDFFGGSFSFINKAQFTQLLRNIASTAVAYAFELAIGAMSEEVQSAMRRFQTVITKMNQHLGNSCQMAQGIVNDTLSAMSQKEHFKRATQESFFGAMGDVWDAVFDPDGADPATTAETSGRLNEDCASDANIVWCVMKKTGVSAHYFAGGDDTLLEAIMSVTGTVVMHPRTDADNGDGKITKHTTLKALPDVIRVILEGGEGEFYQCAGANMGMKGCRLIDRQPRVLENGFTTQVITLVAGDAGIIAKLRDPGAPDLTLAQQHFMGNAPAGFGGMIRNLAVKNETLARSFAERAAPVISYMLLFHIIDDIESHVELSLTSVESSLQPELRRVIEDGKAARRGLIQMVQLQHGNILELYEHYKTVLELLPRNTFGNVVAKSLHHAPKGVE